MGDEPRSRPGRLEQREQSSGTGPMRRAKPTQAERYPDLRPQTPREALLVLKLLAARTLGHENPDPRLRQAAAQITTIADQGLNTRSDFELSDALADRLAEAHRALALVKEHLYGKLPDGDNEIEGIVNQALVLPPDLEAMVERRRT